ncbi:MAG: histone deacetylase family protein [Pseudomonadota bacterium]
METYFSEVQLEHHPQQFMIAGRVVSPFETPDRAQLMADRFRKDGLKITTPADHGRRPITVVHAGHYLDFLESAFEQFAQLPNAGPEALPNVHPHVSALPDFRPRPTPRTQGIVGQLGWYMGDLSSPIGPGTWRAAYASAQTAIAAASAIRDGAREAMALCRPPGHHAYVDRCSGFCFLNNAAIAAEVLRQRYSNVAILDFDTHHGDGTQAIFYARSDVFVGSHHTDPTDYYPFFAGYADETGVGAGSGANLNIPLPPGADDDALVAASEQLISAALAFGAEALVVSMGWDAHRDDPLSRLDVSDAAFSRLGSLYGNIPLPTLLVQEGGYSLQAIERIAPAFISHFCAARALS